MATVGKALRMKKKVIALVDYLIHTDDIKKYKAFIGVWKKLEY